MSYYNNSSGGNQREQVGYNLLAQRTQKLSNLGDLASSSFLKGNADGYFFTLVALRQQLTPNLSPKETKIVNSMEKKIHILKKLSMAQVNLSEIDKPGHKLVKVFKPNLNPNTNNNYMSMYVEKIKKFEQALHIIMKRKGFYPGKADASHIG